jgi:hypothetical protein
VIFSPDGKTLASGSFDRTVILWDVKTRRRLADPLTGHIDVVDSIAFSPDGKTLASGSWDQSILLWDVDIASWQQRACRITNRNLTQLEIDRYIPTEYQANIAPCPGLDFPAPEIAAISDSLPPMMTAPTPTPTATATPVATVTPTPTVTTTSVPLLLTKLTTALATPTPTAGHTD